MKNDLAQLWPHGFKSNLIVAVVATTCVVTSTQSFAEQDGRSGRAGDTTSACTSCHTAGATVPTVTFTSPTTSVLPGSITNYTVAITAGTGGPAVAAGIDVAVSAGTLSATDAGTKLSDATTAGRAAGEIVHNAPKAMTAGTASFTFAWTAPTTPGSATLYVAGFASDGALDAPGDAVTLMTLPVTVAGTAANQPPKPVIEGPTATVADVAETFTGTGSTDPDGTIEIYDWNFGDNTADSGPTVTKTFAMGTWNVTLTVTDNQGLTSTAMLPVTVAAAGTNVPPVAKAGGPYSDTVGTAITFDGTGSTDTAGGTITSYSWDFGDNSTPGADATTSYAYTAPGTYTAVLTVTDNAGATDTDQATVTITAPAAVTPPASATEGETFFAADCSECHGPGLLGGDITGESASDIAEAFIEIPEHAGVANIPQAHIDAIAAFLNGETTTPSPAAADGAGFFATECDSCHGATGAAGSIAGETAEDIATAFIEIPDHAAAGVADIPQDHIDAIAAFLATLDEVDADAVNGAGKPGGNASNGNGGAPANEAPKTDNTSTQANTRTGSSGGAIDLWLISSMLLLGAWRKRSYQNKR